MSDRYQFLKDYPDPLNPVKVFKAGSTVRLSDGDGAALIASGTVKSIPDFTPQRKNALASGGCTQLNEAQKDAIHEVINESVTSNKKK